jgi:transcription-repair coupling factor (superfamily II helicase)
MSDEISPLAENFIPEQRFGGKLKPLVDYLLDKVNAGDKLTIVSRQVPRLKELWMENLHGENLVNPPEFIEGALGDGWVLQHGEEPGVHLLTDSEIFGWERPGPRKQRQVVAETPEAIYADLKTGDWVVHVDYGIGRYIGLVERTLEGVEREYLAVEYDGGDQAFVPVHQADRLSRYIGPDNEQPNPTRLGTAEWNNSKERAREAILEVARELLELYAHRLVAVGYSFSKDTPWQQELEASFPYFETRDQLLAINEVKKDMENSRPMDRLLCGDVGYGKTEVALRAAFKAVMDGRQVAILVPTTVLAQQHYETFRQRLAAFPVQVEMLSRFRTPKEQDEIIKLLLLGKLDIIIGTHRLVQSDVMFKDLGLVIIDEEQRFGVTHKEHFKKLRNELDVLTLTATPIPRTLYMALTGVRDISTINTPPEERQPVITHIGPYSPRLVRQAILRELDRGGQVFFVHNRVQTIHGMQAHINKLVPEARVDIAHGQIPEAELSAVMTRFTHAEVDVLLCTSIIESGLDIPNANTLIVDRGDTFGLAQLYQLRGRVGRSSQRAYAYFFRHKRRPPTPEGLERLEVIAENTQLGAGYSIAMRDLEMRGAGEMLGKRQHGFIAAVGFHLYTRLLAQAVRNLRQIEGLPQIEEQGSILRATGMPANIELPLTMGIPSDYVQEQNMRLRLYRRLSDLQSEAEMDALEEEFTDRFGPLPVMVKNLFYQMRVKLRSERAGIASINMEGDQVVLRYPPIPDGFPGRKMVEMGNYARSGKNAYWILVSGMEESEWKQAILDALSAIIGG